MILQHFNTGYSLVNNSLNKNAKKTFTCLTCTAPNHKYCAFFPFFTVNHHFP